MPLKMTQACGVEKCYCIVALLILNYLYTTVCSSWKFLIELIMTKLQYGSIA